jgi:hypothetical protein
MKIVNVVIVVGLLGLLFGATLPAQMATGQGEYFVRGYVRDEFGAPIAGATVNIKNLRTSDYKQTTTDSNGFYQSDISNMPNGIQTGDIVKITGSKSGRNPADRIAPVDLSVPYLERGLKLTAIYGVWYDYKIYDLDENMHSSAKSSATINVGVAGTVQHPDYMKMKYARLFAEYSMSEKNTYAEGRLHTVVTFYFEIWDQATPNVKMAAIPATSFTDDLYANIPTMNSVDKSGEMWLYVTPNPVIANPSSSVYYIPDDHVICTRAYITCSWYHWIGGQNFGRIVDQGSWTLDAPNSNIQLMWMNYP